jgi:translation elongation factor EF-Tu-like GTPase
MTGTISDLGDRDVITPGSHAEVSIKLQKPIGLEPGMRFAVLKGRRPSLQASCVLHTE